jgi:hypothetical protein
MNANQASFATSLLLALAADWAPAWSQGPPPADPSANLAANLRAVVLQALPTPLFEDTRHWGGQKETARGVKWRGRGLEIHPEIQKSLKNDGRWWKVRVDADRPAETLQVEVRDLKQTEPGRMRFTAVVALNVNVDYDRQKWHEGKRLFSAGLRARLRIVLALQCEVNARFATRGGLLPEAAFRLRVVSSHASYDNLVVEHIAGIGGDAAELFGKAFVKAMQRWRPSLERNLLAKADAAIVKAGDTREVRLSLFNLLSK